MIPLTGVSILLCMVNYLVPAQVAVGSELLVTKKVKLITNFTFLVTDPEELVTNSGN